MEQLWCGCMQLKVHGKFVKPLQAKPYWRRAVEPRSCDVAAAWQRLGG